MMFLKGFHSSASHSPETSFTRLISGLLLAVVFVAAPSASEAQTVSITGPATNVAVIEGDDFATDVLKDPWDFNERRDIGWEENFVDSSISTSGGIWSATNEIAGAWMMPLYPGHKDNLYYQTIPGDTSLPKLGFTNRIDTSKYTYLSYRLKHSDRSNFTIYWEKDESKGQYLGDPTSPLASTNDGYFHNNAFFPLPDNAWELYNFDMTDLATQFAVTQLDWSGDVFALRFDPSTIGAVGSRTDLDWVRLVDPDSAPKINITWDSAGVGFFTVITIYVDDNNSGFDGTPIKRFVSNNDPGTYEVPTAMFPPGDYYFYITAQDVGNSLGPVNSSGYSARLRVNAKPSVVITSPSSITGSDYADVVLNNKWNMKGSLDGVDSDLANLANCEANGRIPDYCTSLWQQFTGQNFVDSQDAEKGGKIFTAVADVPLPGNSETDAQIHLNISQTNPIDPSRYRYLTYRMRIDETNHPTIANKLEFGWVARPVMWNTNVLDDGGRVKAHIVYEGWHTYTIDMWDPDIPENVPGFAAPTPWTSFSQVKNLRIDPLETSIQTTFQFDWVKLTEDNHTTNGQFRIDYTLADADSSNLSVSFYYDNNDSGFDGTLIETVTGLSPGDQRYTWDASDLAESQTLYVYLIITDESGNTARSYASVPIAIGDASPTPAPLSGGVPFDYDGDSVSDQVVYRSATGTYFENRSSTGLLATAFGGSTFVPISADIDGDRKADRGVVTDINGLLFWYITRSSDNQLYSVAWGVTGDDIVIGDYNGNGRDEVAVYRAGSWFVLDESGGATFQPWGLPDDIAVPRDYDGDGKTDFAIWRPSDGNWWIINSGFPDGDTTEQYTVSQWGLPGDLPVPADWSGDGRSDYAVWRPADGTWYVRNIATDAVETAQWGLPGDTPKVGDFNGDGNLDFTVYRDSVGTWFHNYRNGQSGAIQFGLPGDFIPDRAN